MPPGQVVEMHATAPSVRLFEKVQTFHHSYFWILLSQTEQMSDETMEQFSISCTEL